MDILKQDLVHGLCLLVGIICNYVTMVLYLFSNKKYILTNKSNMVYCEKGIFSYMKSAHLTDKKIISISGSGYYGFYNLGVCSYIKEHYDTSNYLFTGTSSGAWNSLFMTLKNNEKNDKMNDKMNDKIKKMKKILMQNELYKNKNAKQILETIKKNILRKYTVDDFDLSRLFIGLTTVGKTHIHTEFDNLEDVLQCCLSSSNVPFISGSIFTTYRNASAFDGIFCKSPFLTTNENVLYIHHTMWNKNKNKEFNLFTPNFFNLEELYEKGYQDTALYGKEKLDKLFTPIVF